MVRIIRINDIIEEVLAHHPDADVTLLQRAYVFAAQAHEGHFRLSGEPYLSHPLEVAYFLAQQGLGPISVACGLLHDTVEDTKTTLKEIEELFGKEIAVIIDGVTKISKFDFKSKLERQAENLRRLILAMSRDIRVLLVKLADRVHNMRTLGYMKPESQRRIAKETLEIFAPLAARLGMNRVRTELEDLAFFYLEPEAYREIQEGLARKRGEREQYIKEITELIQQKLAEHRIQGTVKGRPKHLYGIYRKMQAQQISLDQIYDLIAFRIILQTIPECYEVLGIVHSIWPSVPGRFKDYISLPKPNRYQSLHTTVIGPYGERMEIQIRTEEMDRVAEEGIAAHWAYKEKRQAALDDSARYAWLRQIIEWMKEVASPQDFLKDLALELYSEEVFVFTPKGEIKELPRGSTPVDFAYAIHTEVGHRCAGARVNGRMVPLRYELQHGDVVEIITSPNHTPSRDWLQFVRTNRARAKIKQFLKIQELQKSINLGREILERECRRVGLNLAKLLKTEEELLKAAKELSYVRIDDLLAAIGLGKISATQVLNKLLPRPELPPPDLAARPAFKPAAASKSDGIIIEGLDNILINLAHCCNPIAGDEIIGYITRGKGVTIHRAECPVLARTDSSRHLPASWGNGGSGRHAVRIQVISEDQPGMLAEISNALRQAEANILKASVETRDSQGICWFTIEVTNREHLDKVFNNLRRLKKVTSVQRLLG